MTRTLKSYQELLRKGSIDPDTGQEEAVRALARLEQRLARDRGRRFFWQRPGEATGLYLYGGVGAGKTLLMDLFARSVPDYPTRRVHYHVFMEEMHDFIARWRAMSASERRNHPARCRRAGLDDPIPHAAKRAFQSAELLCLDEMQVTDIADAMLLGRLFGDYFGRGGALVATSNRHPRDLYKDGINRELFLPFIDLLQATLDVHKIDAAKDYRLTRLVARGLYFTPLGEEADQQMEEAFAEQLAGESAEEETLKVAGRRLLLPEAAGTICRASFAHLCERPLGAGDYLAIARRYSTVFIDRIPLLSPENADAAARFRTLIDALYDHRSKLVCSAEAEPDGLYPEGKLAFEFERTASRLYEMRSEGYLKEPHLCRER